MRARFLPRGTYVPGFSLRSRLGALYLLLRSGRLLSAKVVVVMSSSNQALTALPGLAAHLSTAPHRAPGSCLHVDAGDKSIFPNLIASERRQQRLTGRWQPDGRTLTIYVFCCESEKMMVLTDINSDGRYNCCMHQPYTVSTTVNIAFMLVQYYIFSS